MVDNVEGGDYLGQQCGAYRLLRLIGRGNFADVYLGEHVHERSIAAVKVLRTSLSNTDFNAFRYEAETLLHLRHPNIVPLLDVGLTQDHSLFLIMGYAPGGTLSKRYAQGSRLAFHMMIAYVKQIAGALQYAHECQVVHGQLKPENLLLDSHQELLLSDFGLPALTRLADPAITPYTAPEQLQGHPGPASDQYAVGVMIYEWLSGKCPFTGSGDELARQILNTNPTPLREYVASISLEVEWVVLATLAKDPTVRFTSMRAMVTALDQAGRPALEPLPHTQSSLAAQKPALGTPLQNYRDHVSGATAIAWSPDGTRIASSGQDDTQIHVWEAGTGRLLLVYANHTGAVTAIAWSPDSSRIASGSPDGTIQIWEVVKGALLATCRPFDRAEYSNSSLEEGSLQITPIVWSPDGRRIATASYANRYGMGEIRPHSVSVVQVWDAGTGSLLQSFNSQANQVLALAWSRDGKVLAICIWPHTVQLWQVAKGKLKSTFRCYDDTGMTAAALSPDAEMLATGAYQCAIQLWETAKGKLLIRDRDQFVGNVLSAAPMRRPVEYRPTLVHPNFTSPVTALTWSADSRRIAIDCNTGCVQIWELDRRAPGLHGPIMRRNMTYFGHSAWVRALSWSPDGQRMVSASSYEVLVWETAQGNSLYTYKGHRALVRALAWSPDGGQIASAGGNDVHLWDVKSGRRIRTYTGHAGVVSALAWSSDGRRIASGGTDGTVQIWEAAAPTGNALFIQTGAMLGSTQALPVVSVAWSPDGTRVVCYTHGQQVWNAISGERLLDLRGHGEIAWSPDGSRIASIDSHVVQIVDAASGEPLLKYEGHRQGESLPSVAWSPEGSRLASASESEVHIWDATSAKLLATCQVHMPRLVLSPKLSPDDTVLNLLSIDGAKSVPEQRVVKVAWASDGERLASGSSDGSIRVWNAATGELIYAHKGDSRAAGVLVWSPDGTRIASVNDGVQIWQAL